MKYRNGLLSIKWGAEFMNYLKESKEFMRKE